MDGYSPIKIVICGEGGTGKSTLLSAKKSGKFVLSHKITIGIDFSVVPIECNYLKVSEITLLVFDLGGQQRFQFIHDAYLRGTRGVILSYDLTRPSTFDQIPNWLKLIHNENETIPIVLVGSKKDLVQSEDITAYTRRFTNLSRQNSECKQIVAHLFISSKNYEGIDELFEILIHSILTSEKLELIAHEK